MDKEKFVKSIPTLKNFSDKFVSKLTQIMELVNIEEGEMIFSEGDSADHLFIIIEGEGEL